MNSEGFVLLDKSIPILFCLEQILVA